MLTAINAKYIHSNPAIYSLRAYAGEELQPYIELAEYTINQPMQEILADIYRRNPDVIGFSCYIWNWRLGQELVAYYICLAIEPIHQENIPDSETAEEYLPCMTAPVHWRTCWDSGLGAVTDGFKYIQ